MNDLINTQDFQTRSALIFKKLRDRKDKNMQRKAVAVRKFDVEDKQIEQELQNLRKEFQEKYEVLFKGVWNPMRIRLENVSDSLNEILRSGIITTRTLKVPYYYVNEDEDKIFNLTLKNGLKRPKVHYHTSPLWYATLYDHSIERGYDVCVDFQGDEFFVYKKQGESDLDWWLEFHLDLRVLRDKKIFDQDELNDFLNLFKDALAFSNRLKFCLKRYEKQYRCFAELINIIPHAYLWEFNRLESLEFHAKVLEDAKEKRGAFRILRELERLELKLKKKTKAFRIREKLRLASN